MSISMVLGDAFNGINLCGQGRRRRSRAGLMRSCKRLDEDLSVSPPQPVNISWRAVLPGTGSYVSKPNFLHPVFANFIYGCLRSAERAGEEDGFFNGATEVPLPFAARRR